MASIQSLESQGMQLAMSANTAYTTMVVIDGNKNINFRTGSATVLDDTDLESAAKMKRMGLQDEGQLTFTIKFTPGNVSHEMLLTAKNDRAPRAFEVRMTNTPQTKYRFLGFVLSVPITSAVDSLVESSVTVEISGAVTVAPAP